MSSNVVMKLMAAKVRKPEDEEAIEAEDLARPMEELAGAVASHGGKKQPLSSPGLVPPPEEPAVVGDMECPCGSGKKFSECQLNVRWLAYGELERHREAMGRFGSGMKALDAIARSIT